MAVVVLAAFTVLGGLVAALAGAYGLRRTRRISAGGAVTQALVKAALPGAERPTLQFETGDGRVVEVVSPVPPSRRAPLAAGDRVGIAYDVEDPRETVLIGGERTGLDRAFVGAGVALMVLGAVLAVAVG
ncbi:DUF3592 domain-containing protein [Streptomyces venezuelae]|uniref:DUF3592 domain-containing protein n=1 Tax=Streptomyces venezuelae TaxID=54571 RepID=UPI001CC266A7|nr:DUF3592 domain-containing protein [Streptomyces venezuelae]